MTKYSEVELFTKENGEVVSYETLLKDIYENSADTKADIKLLSTLLTTMIGNSVANGVAFMPFITELLNSQIKNDDILVKVAGIISRSIKAASSKGGGDTPFEITEAERVQLLADVSEVIKTPIVQKATKEE